MTAPMTEPILFEVATNPEPDSTLPFLIRLPLTTGELVLKARDSWPRTAKVYCHRAERWPEEPRDHRARPDPLLPTTRRRDRPGARPPTGEPLPTRLHPHPRRPRRDLLAVRAHHPPSPARDPRPPPARRRAQRKSRSSSTAASATPTGSPSSKASIERQALPAGDYGIADDDDIVAVVERKSLDDLVRRLIDGQLTYAIADLATLPRAAVVVEDRYSSLFKLEHTKPGFVTELLAALTVRYPTVPIHFAETRPLAEEWTYRFLGAALAYHQADRA